MPRQLLKLHRSPYAFLVCVCSLGLQPGWRFTSQVAAADWPQVQQNAGHTGYSADAPQTPFTLKWVRDLEEPTHTASQPIVVGDQVFVGTNWGNLIALDRKTGQKRWSYATDAPILGSPAYDSGLVFVNSMDRQCHAVDARSGNAVWRFRTGEGLWAAPVVADSCVYVAGRDDYVYALDVATGNLRWRSPVGSMVMATPAYDQGVLFVAAGDNRVHAIQGHNGQQLWTSTVLPGAAIRDYWLVASGGSVIAATQFVRGCHDTYDDIEKQIMKPYRQRSEGKPLDQEFLLNAITDWLTEHPEDQSLFVLDAHSGEQKFVTPVIQVHGGGCTGPLPVIGGDGVAYVMFTNVRVGASGWAFVGQLDLNSGQIKPLVQDRYWVSDRHWEWQAAPGTKLSQRSAFDTGFCVNDQSWGLCTSATSIFAVRDPGWCSGEVSYSYIDLESGKDRWLQGGTHRSILREGSFGGAFHATCSPMAISGRQIFHKTARNAIACFEGS